MEGFKFKYEPFKKRSFIYQNQERIKEEQIFQQFFRTRNFYTLLQNCDSKRANGKFKQLQNGDWGLSMVER